MMKEEKAEEWMSRNGIPDVIKRDIMPYVRSSLQENDDVDLETMLSILPRKHKMSLKRHLCFAVLKRVRIITTKERMINYDFYCCIFCSNKGVE